MSNLCSDIRDEERNMRCRDHAILPFHSFLLSEKYENIERGMCGMRAVTVRAISETVKRIRSEIKKIAQVKFLPSSKELRR